MAIFKGENMRIILPYQPDAVIRKSAELLSRKIGEILGDYPSVIAQTEPVAGDIVLDISSGQTAESFRISLQNGVVRIDGGDSAGVLYGCGWLLRNSKVIHGAMEFKPTEKIESPEHAVRGIYFATHFYNYFHNAPIEEICAYIEELALWGANAFLIWFDMHHYSGIDEPAAQEHLVRLKAMHSAARGVGMKIGITTIANESYNNSPEELRADQSKLNVCVYGVELCPSKPDGLRLIVKGLKDEFTQFDHLDYLMIWPYDQGGCGCDDCRPWGANGFLKAGEAVSKEFRDRWPNGKVILSTWLFDYPGNVNQGEWDGLYKYLEGGVDWIDYILADGHKEFPEYPLQKPVPGGIPIINFPEISMLDMNPWGGYGVNPLPGHWQSMWNRVGDRIAGSFPYVEGKFTDLNLIIWLQFNWNSTRKTTDIIREYAAYEFSPDDADEIARALELMENTHCHTYNPAAAKDYVHMKSTEDADEIWRIISETDSKLPERVRDSWRWRLVYLRAKIDRELKASGGNITPAVCECFDEIWRMYYAEERSWENVRPIRLS